MFTPAENHSTVTVTPALERFSGRRTIAFINARASDISGVIWRGCVAKKGRGRRRRRGDEGSHWSVDNDLGWL
jgi:hypothetical protein